MATAAAQKESLAFPETGTERFSVLAAQAEVRIQEYEKAGVRLGEVSETLANLERDRSIQKTGAILRLCQKENPATPGKPYSASQAADFAQLDPEYNRYKLQVQSFSLLKLDAEIELQAARFRTELAIARFRAEGGLR